MSRKMLSALVRASRLPIRGTSADHTRSEGSRRGDALPTYLCEMESELRMTARDAAAQEKK